MDPPIAMLVAFISSIPESVANASGMQSGGWQRGELLLPWTFIVGVCGLASAGGYGLFGGASNELLSFVNPFAGGAPLALLATS